MKIKEAIRFAEEKLKSAGIDDYNTDGKLILFHLFNWDETALILNGNKEMEDEDLNTYINIVEKRANHIPLQEIFHKGYFYGEEFIVNKDVLTPRKETEILVENCIYIIGRKNTKNVLDLCTGSGIISIILKKKFPTINIYASDISKEALKVAKENASIHKADVKFIESDLFNNIEGTFDLIISNPPYIKKNDIFELTEEVKKYDPILALDGGIDGLDYYREIVNNLNQYLNDEGYVAFEIGYDEGEEVKKLLEETDIFKDIKVIKDYSNLDRVIIAKKGTGI